MQILSRKVDDDVASEIRQVPSQGYIEKLAQCEKCVKKIYFPLK